MDSIVSRHRFLVPVLLAAVFAVLLDAGPAAAAEGGPRGTNTIKGRLARADGTPVKGVKVRAHLLPNDLKSGFTVCGEVLTDDKGGFVLDKLPDGLFCLLADNRPDGRMELLDLCHTINAYVQKGETKNLGSLTYDVVNPTLRGRVVNRTHDDSMLAPILPGVRVYWQQGEGILLGPVLTMKDGFFSLRLRGWHAGMGENQILRFVDSCGTIREQRVRVKPEALVTLEIPRDFPTHYVTGRVSSGGVSLEGVKILFVPDQAGRFVSICSPQVTSVNGTYRIDNLSPGRWRAYAFRSPWEVQGKKIQLDGKMVQLSFDFPERQTHSVDFSCKVTVEGVDYGAWLRRTMPAAAARQGMNMVLALVPEGFDIRKDCLPPAAAFLPCDAGTYKTKLGNVPDGKYRVFLGLGVKAETDATALGKRDATKGGAFASPVFVSPCGWSPMQHPKVGFAGAIDGTVVEVKAGSRIRLERDFKLADLLLLDELPENRQILSFYREILDKMKGGGE